MANGILHAHCTFTWSQKKWIDYTYMHCEFAFGHVWWKGLCIRIYGNKYK